MRFDKYRVKKQGQRIFKDVDLYNVIAVLPGKTMPETQVLISGHYDSLNLGTHAARARTAGRHAAPADSRAITKRTPRYPRPAPATMAAAPPP